MRLINGRVQILKQPGNVVKPSRLCFDKQKEVIDMTEENTVNEQETTQKTFTEDYVKALREEAKTNRLKAKQYQTLLQKVTGLQDEDFDEAKVTNWKIGFESEWQKKNTEVLTKANERLLQAEIKSLEGYDAKLVSRLLDRSKVTIKDDGSIEGLKETVEALVAEFPQVKIAPKQQAGANPPPTEFKGEVEKLKDEYEQAVKGGNLALQVALKNKIYALEHK